ncbi:MAG: hypothetical protein NC918_05590 [Candidatus Omnitrophica bacterium]|nr:hypothetical protein [Candidatus Omnitrophota bacterium]
MLIIFVISKKFIFSIIVLKFINIRIALVYENIKNYEDEKICRKNNKQVKKILLAGIPIRVGYAHKWDFLLTHKIEDKIYGA